MKQDLRSCIENKKKHQLFLILFPALLINSIAKIAGDEETEPLFIRSGRAAAWVAVQVNKKEPKSVANTRLGQSSRSASRFFLILHYFQRKDPNVTDSVRRSYQDDAPITPTCSTSLKLLERSLQLHRTNAESCASTDSLFGKPPSDASPQSRSA